MKSFFGIFTFALTKLKTPYSYKQAGVFFYPILCRNGVFRQSKELKGNEALEEKKFLLQGKEIWIKIKIKKLNKILYFRLHKRLFGSEARELNGGERGVFFEVINAVNN